jgi:hypothetical protein
MPYYIARPHTLDEYEEETATIDAAFWRAGELSADQKSGPVTIHGGPFVVWHWAPGKKRGEQVKRVRAIGKRGRAMWAVVCHRCKGTPLWAGPCTSCNGDGYVEDTRP